MSDKPTTTGLKTQKQIDDEKKELENKIETLENGIDYLHKSNYDFALSLVTFYADYGYCTPSQIVWIDKFLEEIELKENRQRR